jgi:putative methyltransferase (TIGR04325 family)
MVERGRSLQCDELRFFPDLAQACAWLERVDLVFSSGAIQYCPSPYETLRALVSCGARFLLLTNVGLSKEARELITVQSSQLSANGPAAPIDGAVDQDVAYPVTIMGKEKFEGAISESYVLKLALDGIPRAYSWQGQDFNMYGYLAERKGI